MLSLLFTLPGIAAVGVLVNTFCAKFYMTAVFMGGGKSPEVVQKMKAHAAYENASRAQLNKAEYSPLLAAMLLYLHVKGAEPSVACSLAVFGQVMYFWGRVATGTQVPCAPLGGIPRYISMGMPIWAIYITLENYATGRRLQRLHWQVRMLRLDSDAAGSSKAPICICHNICFIACDRGELEHRPATLHAF